MRSLLPILCALLLYATCGEVVAQDSKLPRVSTPADSEDVSIQFGTREAATIQSPRRMVRLWTDRAGRQFRGEFLGLSDGRLQIRRESDGKTFEVLLERFSDADQAFVRNETRADPSKVEKLDSNSHTFPKATLKVPSYELEKGQVTVEIDWGNAMPPINSREMTLVLLFQDKTAPLLTLNTQILARMSNNWELGLLDNGCSWVLRTTSDPTADKGGEVLQVVSRDADAKQEPDYRVSGKYTCQFRLNYTDNRWLNTENVQIALFQEIDSMNWQQSSTSYQILSNVVELRRNQIK